MSDTPRTDVIRKRFASEKVSSTECAALYDQAFELEQECGMSMRDYFAAAALQGLLASGYRLPTHAARDAFNQADAMLQARKEVSNERYTKDG